jgi:hypothetical protein
MNCQQGWNFDIEMELTDYLPLTPGCPCESVVVRIKHNKQIIVFANEVKQSSSELRSDSELDCFANARKDRLFIQLS